MLRAVARPSGGEARSRRKREKACFGWPESAQRRSALALPGAALLPRCGLAHAQRVDLVNRTALRVCADPANLPFSNDKVRGLREQDRRHRRGRAQGAGRVRLVSRRRPASSARPVRQTLRCGVGYAQGDDLVLNTNAYYRSTYALVFRGGTGLDGVDTLAEPRLQDKRIGIVAARRQQRHGPARSHAARQAVSADGGPTFRFAGEHEQDTFRRHRCRRAVGTDRRIFAGKAATRSWWRRSPRRRTPRAWPIASPWGAPGRGRLEAPARHRDRQAGRPISTRCCWGQHKAARRAIQSDHPTPAVSCVHAIVVPAQAGTHRTGATSRRGSPFSRGRQR